MDDAYLLSCVDGLRCRAARRLCKIKYYNNCLFYNVQQNFIVQSGDPTNTGKGGESIWGVLYGEQVCCCAPPLLPVLPVLMRCATILAHQARLFEDEIRPHLKHKRKGLLGMAGECWACASSHTISID